jgi:hypothetical protein
MCLFPGAVMEGQKRSREAWEGPDQEWIGKPEEIAALVYIFRMGRFCFPFDIVRGINTLFSLAAFWIREQKESIFTAAENNRIIRIL